MATTPNYEINYDDERFDQVEQDKSNALSDLEKTYTELIGQSDKYYQDQINASKDWADTQSQLQQEKTDHTINQINQQKEQAQKDYTKEQSGAYVDWQKQSNRYGSEAEKMASAGLANTGFSESSQVSMYNTYQNRVAQAREVIAQATLNYDNAIKDAQLQNSSILAEIAYNSLQQQLELSLQGFQYKNSLILEQMNKKTELNNTYYNRYLDVLNQINTENAMAEDVRQFNENQTFQAAQAELDRNFQAAQAELEREHDKAMLEAQTEKEKELLEIQHQKDMEKLEQQHKYDLELLKKSKSSSSSSGSKTGSDKGNDGDVINSTPSDVQALLDKGYIQTPDAIKLGIGPRTKDFVAKCVAAGLITAVTASDGKTYFYNHSGVTSNNVEARLKLAGY